MRGRNPYLDAIAERRPTKPYTITVQPAGITVVVDPEKLSDGDHGLPGSILGQLLDAGVDIDHACGGVLACSTCHVYVSSGGKSCGDASEEEEDMLDGAPALRSTSRLACQSVPDGSSDIVVEIPAWNRNAVKEGH
jgi:2Fe-2S ferredoxin